MREGREGVRERHVLKIQMQVACRGWASKVLAENVRGCANDLLPSVFIAPHTGHSFVSQPHLVSLAVAISLSLFSYTCLGLCHFDNLSIHCSIAINWV